MRNVVSKAAAVALAGSMALLGCAHEFAGTGSQQVGVRAGPTNGVQAALYSTGLYGPNVAVARGKLSYRGNLLNRSVDLGWNTAQVFGMVDSAPTKLNWSSTGDGLRIHGLYAGKLSDLRITSQSIEGSIGGCGYSLVADRRGYVGRSTCVGGFDHLAEVTLPADLGARSEGEQVALISLLLSSADRSLMDRARLGEEPGPGVDYYWRGGSPLEEGAPYSEISPFAP
jgi:hypothetical protein